MQSLLQSLIICMPLAVFSFNAMAIVNIESMRVSNLEFGWHSSLGLNIDGSTGNSEATGSNLNWRLSHTNERHHAFILADYAYGEANGTKATDNALLHGRWVWNHLDNYSPESFIQLQQNSFIKLRMRQLAGGGLRWRIFNSANKGLFVGGGAFHEREELDDESVIEQIRWNSYINYRWELGALQKAGLTLYFQPSAENDQDRRALLQASYRIAMAKRLSLVLQLDVSHDSEPPAGVQDTDVKYNNGLNYRF